MTGDGNVDDDSDYFDSGQEPVHFIPSHLRSREEHEMPHEMSHEMSLNSSGTFCLNEQ